MLQFTVFIQSGDNIISPLNTKLSISPKYS